MPTFILRRLRSYPGAVISSPPTIILPPVGGSSMFMHRSRVDLPQPDAPITAITSPLWMVVHTSFSGMEFGYAFCKCCNSIIVYFLSTGLAKRFAAGAGIAQGIGLPRLRLSLIADNLQSLLQISDLHFSIEMNTFTGSYYREQNENPQYLFSFL